MASVHTVLAAMQANVSAVTVGLGLTVKVGIDWPPENVLMANVRPGGAVVTVFDRKLARNTTRWKPITLGTTLVPATLTSSVTSGDVLLGSDGQPIVADGGGAIFSDPTISPFGNSLYPIRPSQSALIVLGGTVTVGDAVSCIITRGSLLGTSGETPPGESPIYTPTWAQIVSAITGDTLTTMATKLATAINNDAILSDWVTATASGATVVIKFNVPGTTALLSDPDGQEIIADGGGVIFADAPRSEETFLLQSFTGHGATEIVELGRRSRELQVVVWTRSIEDRDTVSDAIETMLQSMETTYGQAYQSGLAFPDGTSGRVTVMNDYLLDEAVLSDTYRHDFLVSVDYPVTVVDNLYTVLAQITQYQFGYNVAA